MARTLINSVDITPATTAQIGDIIHSMLTEAEFQAIRGTDWVLADGRDATGTGYGVVKTGDAVTPVNLPDLRGRFLRGKDHGRHLIDGKGNPDGDLAIGQEQGDALGSHDHDSGVYVPTQWSKQKFGYTGSTVQRSDTNQFSQDHRSTITSTSGGDETRSANTTVNFFIKIDDIAI